MGGWLHDLRYGVRRLAASPGFSAAAALTLALGIGANVAVFSVVDGVMLRPLPLPDPERLVFITREGDVSIPDGKDWRASSRTLEEIALFLRSWDLDLVGSGEPLRLNAAVVEPQFFRVLRLPALRGRLLADADNRPGAPGAALISAALWRGRFGGEPSVVGREILLSDVPTTVVGIAPAEMDFMRDGVELWVTPAAATAWALEERGTNNFDAIGRLRAGVRIEEARAEMLAISRRLEAAYPETNRGKLVELLPLLDFMVGHARRALLVLLCAVALLVLVSSLNLATAFAARSAARQEEFAVRVALGAGGSRLARQILVEGLALALAGGALGVLAAAWTRDALVGLAADSLPRSWSISLDWRVLGFGFALAAGVGLTMSLLPAWAVLRGEPAGLLRSGGRGRSAAAPRRLMGILVTSEVAFAVLLLVGSGLLLRTFAQLQRVRLGFDPERVVMAQVTLPESRYGDRRQDQTRVFREIVGRLSATAGIESAAYVITPPLEPRGGIGGGVAFREPPPAMPVEKPGARGRLVLGDYFRTLGIPIIAGRGFTPDDDEQAPRVAIVNERFAKDFWPGESPLGRQIAWVGWTEGSLDYMTIVGVAADVKGTSLDAPDFRSVYAPYVQRQAGWQRWGTILARARIDEASFARTLQQALWAEDPAIPLGRVEALAARRDRLLGPQRFNALALASFAAVALLVALQGLYALLSRAVEERRREMGVRMALGAEARDLLRLVISRGLRLTLLGFAAGSMLALALGRVVASLLYEVAPNDPAVLAAAALLLGATALLACYLPARRASRLDPVAALRCD